MRDEGRVRSDIDQFLRMSQARRWLQHSQGVGARLWGCLTTQTHSYSDSLFLTQTRFRYFRTQILSCPEPLTHTHCEDVSGEALVSALPRGSRQSGDAPGFASGLWGCLKRFACLVDWTCVRARRWQQEEGGGGGGGGGGRERGGGG